MEGILFQHHRVAIDPRCTEIGGSWQGPPVRGAPTSWDSDLSLSAPVFVFARLYGIDRAAIGAMIGMLPLAVAYDLIVQRKLLRQRSWAKSLSVYAKPLLSGAAIVGIAVLAAAVVNPLWVRIAVRLAVALLGPPVAVLLLERSTVLELRSRLRGYWLARYPRQEVAVAQS